MDPLTSVFVTSDSGPSLVATALAGTALRSTALAATALAAPAPAAGVPRLWADGLASPHGGPFSLTVDTGECVAIVGRSGSGKSMLLRLIADLDPHTGEVHLEGRSRSTWSGPEWRRQVVYQAAEPAWWAATVAEHLASANRLEMATALARLGLDDALLDADITRLSTGERQRFALLRSLAAQPRALLLDEPTASLDEGSTRAVEALLVERVKAGLALIVVTHSRAQADRLGQRVLEMRERALHDCTPAR